MKHLLSRVREDFDWQSYVETNFAIKYTSNGELRVSCFACGDSKFKLYVNPDKGAFHCFKCSFNSGNFDLFDFVARSEGTSRAAAMLRLTREYTPTTPVDLRDALKNQKPTREVPSVSLRYVQALPKGCILLRDANSSVESPFWDYLHSRGLSDAEIRGMETHCIPLSRCELTGRDGSYKGDLGRRVVWPVREPTTKKLVSWISRTIVSNYTRSDKYLNCPDSDLSKVVWPPTPPKNGVAVLVEGMLDAVALRRAGWFAYASFGKKVSIEQFRTLRAWGVSELVIFFDKKDAKKEILKTAEEAKMYFSKVFVPDFSKIPDDMDAGDCLVDNSGGIDIIKSALTNRVDVYSSKFLLWQLQF